MMYIEQQLDDILKVRLLVEKGAAAHSSSNTDLE